MLLFTYYHNLYDVRYAKERAEERSARLTGLVNPGACGGKKMAAFHASSYGSDAVTQLMVDVAKEVYKFISCCTTRIRSLLVCES